MNFSDIVSRAKKRLFKLVRLIPSIRDKIQRELDVIEKKFEDEMEEYGQKTGYIVKLPETGMEPDLILEKVDSYMDLGNSNWKDGLCSGAVYNFDEKVIDLMTEVFRRTAYTNPLHADIFPGINKMEAEVIRMAATLFNGDDESCGSITSGGTESILLACRAYRNYGREEKGIEKPNMVLPVTAHTAFDKAADYLGIRVRRTKLDTKTYKADLKALEKAIDSNTIMVNF